MRDTIAQTRFENVSKLSNDSLLARGKTLRSDEDRLKLDELMAFCTTLQSRVLDLEKTKTNQANDIASLKRRVKKLKKKRRSRTHKLKMLYKVGLSVRVESSRDEESLGDDASKQGRINAIDADEDITLFNVQDDADKEMYDVGTVTGDEVFAEQEVVAKDVNLTVDEVTLAQALAALKSVKSKVSAATTTTATIPTPMKGIIITELGTPTITRSLQQPSQAKVQDKGKGKMIEPKPVKKISKKYQLKSDEEEAKRLQAEFDEEERLIEADHELPQRLPVEEQEELSVEEKAKLFQQLLEQRRKHFAAKSRRAKKQTTNPSSTKKNHVAFKRVNTFVDFRTDLVEGSSKRAGEELEQESTKKQKVDEDKDIAELQSLMEVIPDKEEVLIDAIPLAIKSPSIVGWKIHKEGKKSYYQIMRAHGKSQMYRIFSHMLKNFSREDLEDLYKLVKGKYELRRPVEDLDLLLWGDLKIMFEPHVEDTVWRNQQDYKVLEWKLYELCEYYS
ncbi:hypothetical protein Tco_0216932 [Tanacetum coccineum]